MDLAPGDRVDRYVLVRLLGEGGQGAVWKADDPLEPAHPRALKLVPLVRSRPADVERIRREARALARLDHPSLVGCSGLFEDLRQGLLGLSMDFVDGVSLRALRDDPAFSARHRVAVLTHIASALAYLHGEAVVHRDLKPENVLVTSEFLEHPDDPANVKLVDFGIASEEGNPNPLTALDSVVGTLSYLAPELVDPGFFGRQISAPAADVFAFGVLAWQLLAETRHPTGLPARATIIEYGIEYRRVAQLEVPFPADGPDGEWGELLRGCLAVRSKDRIQNGRELTERCERAARSNIVIRPRQAPTGAPSERPTAVESPAASVGDTAFASVSRGADPASEPAPVEAAVALRSPSASAATARTALTAERPPQKPSRTGALILALGAILVAGAAGSWWLLFGPGGGAAAPSQPPALAPAIVPSAEPVVSAPAASAVTPEAGAVGTRPADCAADAALCDCCPSGHDCGGACDEPLPPDMKVALRLARVDGDAPPGADVCIGARDVSPAMICQSTADAGAQMLTLTVGDLEHGGLTIQLKSGNRALATRTDAALADIPRSALCKGVEIGGFEGSVRVDAVHLYLDPDGSEPAACPPPARP